MRQLIYIFLFILIFNPQVNAQLGCTDPQANNYDANADENDGSCTYDAINYMAEEITEIPVPLTEASGLAFFEDKLWTHMDGGNEDKIYQIDTLTGAILKTVILVGGENIDWEELAQDEEYLYVGDFGNNPGNRTDLRIYRIEKSQFSQSAVTAEIIDFSFSDQTDFTLAHNMNNYDCEAFFEHNDSLHLFSKNWTDFKTRHYVLPKTPGTHVAELRDSFLVEGQITAADISQENEVVLLGYNVVTGQSFFWLLFDYKNNDFFSGNKRKINLGNVVTVSQPEGLVFSHGREGFICSENITIFPPKLLKFSILDWVTNDTSSVFDIPEINLDFTVFPNPTSGDLNIIIDILKTGKYQTSVFNNLGQKLFSKKHLLYKGESEFSVNLKRLKLPKGNYIIQISGEDFFGRTQFIKH